MKLNKASSRYIKISALSLIAVAIIIIWRTNDPRLLRSLRDFTFDSYQKAKPREAVRSGVRVILIDEKSINLLGQWPWSRTVVARLIDRLGNLGAAAIGLDMVFSEPDRTGPTALIKELEERGEGNSPLVAKLKALPDNDRILQEAIAEWPVTLGYFPIAETENVPLSIPQQKAGISFVGDVDPAGLLPIWPNAVVNLEGLSEVASGKGALSLSPANTGDVVRKVPLLYSNGEDIYPSLALESLRLAVRSPSLTILTSTSAREVTWLSKGINRLISLRISGTSMEVPVDEGGNLQVYYAPEQPDRFISASDILLMDEEELAPLISGQIVLVGVSAMGARDIHTNAFGLKVPGVAIHAQILGQILMQSYIHRPDWAAGAERALTVVTAIVLILVLPVAGAFTAVILGTFITVLIGLISWLAFANHGLLIDPVFPLLATALVFSLNTILRFATSERDRFFVRSAFGKYLAPEVVRLLENSPENLKLGGDVREVTVLFMDVRGFTSISEQLSPTELVDFLNRLLTPLSDIIMNNEGTIDKFIGDSIMAYWNAPSDVKNHREKALVSGLEMLECLKTLNRADEFGFNDRNLSPVEIGIGINCGKAWVGNMGSHNRFDYSMVGDVVNVSARIESSCKTIGWPLLSSRETIADIEDLVTLDAGSIHLKGKSQPLELFAVLGRKEIIASDGLHELVEWHEAMVEARRAGNRTRFDNCVAKCRELAPPHLYRFYSAIEFPVGLAAPPERQKAVSGV